MIKSFFNTTDYSARAFEVAMHGLFQAMDELNLLCGVDVVPLSQMRSANKKGSSDKCVPGCMNSQDFKFEKLKVSIAIGLTFKGFDFIIQTF